MADAVAGGDGAWNGQCQPLHAARRGRGSPVNVTMTIAAAAAAAVTVGGAAVIVATVGGRRVLVREAGAPAADLLSLLPGPCQRTGSRRPVRLIVVAAGHVAAVGAACHLHVGAKRRPHAAALRQAVRGAAGIHGYRRERRREAAAAGAEA